MHATLASAEPLDPFGAFVSRVAPNDLGQGALAGLRLCVKDNIGVEGQPFTAGHPLFADRRAERTAPVIQRFLTAGASFVGMTRTDSGGFGVTTPEVRNPKLPGCTVGGSSGGIAAAVASGLADVGIGTDTGGSIRIPAACTGLFGFKPSYGRVPLDEVWPLAPSFDHVGLVASEWSLFERAVEVMLSSGAGELGRARLAIAVDDRSPAYADPTIRAQFDDALAKLERAGHELTFCALPDRQVLTQAFGTLVIAEAQEIYAKYTAAERSRLGTAAQRALSAAPSAPEIERSRRTIGAARRLLEACLQSFDILLSPSLFVRPPPQGVHSIKSGDQKWPLVQVLLSGTCFCNLLGVPALSVPVWDRSVPFSLHIASRHGSDLDLLRMGNLVHRALEGEEADVSLR